MSQPDTVQVETEEVETEVDKARSAAAKQREVKRSKGRAEALIDYIKKTYKMPINKPFSDQGHCSDSGSCQFETKEIVVDIYGYIIHAHASSYADKRDYMNVCAAIYATLSGRDNSEQLMLELFTKAAKSEDTRGKLENVEIYVEVNSSGLIECRFVKFGDK